jgi:hypothetical protein
LPGCLGQITFLCSKVLLLFPFKSISSAAAPPNYTSNYHLLGSTHRMHAHHL